MHHNILESKKVGIFGSWVLEYSQGLQETTDECVKYAMSNRLILPSDTAVFLGDSITPHIIHGGVEKAVETSITALHSGPKRSYKAGGYKFKSSAPMIRNQYFARDINAVLFFYTTEEISNTDNIILEHTLKQSKPVIILNVENIYGDGIILQHEVLKL